MQFKLILEQLMSNTTCQSPRPSTRPSERCSSCVLTYCKYYGSKGISRPRWWQDRVQDILLVDDVNKSFWIHPLYALQCTDFKCITKRTHGSSCDEISYSICLFASLFGIDTFHATPFFMIWFHHPDSWWYDIQYWSSSNFKMLIDPFHFSTHPTFLKNMWHLMNPIAWYLSTGGSLFRTCYQRSAAYHIYNNAHTMQQSVDVGYQYCEKSPYIQFGCPTIRLRHAISNLSQDPWNLLSFRLRYVHIWKVNKASRLYCQQTKAASTSRRMVLIMLYTWPKTEHWSSTTRYSTVIIHQHSYIQLFTTWIMTCQSLQVTKTYIK